MMGFGEVWRRIRFLILSRRFDRDLDEEMRLHMEMQADEYRAAGMDVQEAGFAAQRQFGNAALLKELSGDAWGWRPLERLCQDAHYAARVLRKSPIFTVSVALTLALGIGANTAIFSLVNALLFHPYPFPESERIMAVEAFHARSDTGGSSYRDFLDWREQNTVFEEMAIVPWTYGHTLTGLGEPRRLVAGVTTAGFMRVLGVQPCLGRFFTPEEDRPGGPHVVLLSFAAWQQSFGGRSDILGQVVTLNSRPYTIIGVMPDHFAFPGIYSCELWMPLQEHPANSRNQHQYGAMARLRPGIAVEQAQAELKAIAHRLEQQYPETNTGWSVIVMPMAEAMSPAIRTGLLTLAAAVIFVLVLTCANVAALLLARGSGRAREVAVRVSLGAGRGRIIRQLLTESLLLSVPGGALGLLVAKWLMEVMRKTGPPEFWLDTVLRLDARVLLFALAITFLSAVLFGLAPAWHGSRTDFTNALKGGSRSGPVTRSRNRLLSTLVAGEFALSLVLLVPASLLAKDFVLLFRTDLGIRTDRVLTFALNLPGERYSPERTSGFYRDLLDRLHGAPGVEIAAAISSLPLGGHYTGTKFEIEGRPKPNDRMEMSAQSNIATPGYLACMGIPLLRGRDFNLNDTANSRPVVLIDETFARRYFPDEDPLGRRLKAPDWKTIVGVTGAVKHNGPAWRKEGSPLIYVPHEQDLNRSMTVVARIRDDPKKLAPVVRGVVQSLDAQLPILRLRSMGEVLFEKLKDQMLMDSFMAAFAGFALLLTAIGVYGVIAFSVSQRRHEIGVRIALGASRAEVVAMVLRRSLTLVLMGVAVGMPLAVSSCRLLSSLLYGVSPGDMAVFAGVPLLLLIVALAAGYLPAHYAALVDPLEALRDE